jgi:hypothetical protein
VHLHQKVPHKNRPLKSAARAAAIHECSVSAAKYLDYSWGTQKCMSIGLARPDTANNEK